MGGNSPNHPRYLRWARQPVGTAHAARHWQTGAESIFRCSRDTTHHAEQACVAGGSVAVRAGQSERSVSADRRAVGIYRRKTNPTYGELVVGQAILPAAAFQAALS